MSKKFKKIINIAWRILLAFFIGGIISIAYLQEDVWVKNKLENYINSSMSSILKAKFSCKINKINLFSGNIELIEINSESYNKAEWSLNIPYVSFQISFKDLFLNFEPYVFIYCKKAHLKSTLKNGSFSFIEAINSYLEYPSIVPLKLKNCLFSKSILELSDMDSSRSLKLVFNGISQYHKYFIKLNISCLDGNLYYYNQNYWQNIKGCLGFDIPLDASDYMDNCNLNVSLDLPQYKFNNHQDSHCYVTGEYKKKQGIFRLKNYKQTIKVNSILDLTNSSKDFKFNGHIPLELFNPMIKNKLCLPNSVKGSAIVQGHLNLNDNESKGNMTANISGLNINNKSLDNWRLNISLKDQCMKFDLTSDSRILPLSGNATWDLLSNNGVIDLYNSGKLNLNDISIPPNYFKTKVIFKNDNINNNLDFKIKSVLCGTRLNSNKNINMQVSIVKQKSLIKLNSKLNSYKLYSLFDLDNNKLECLRCIDLNESKLLEVRADKNNINSLIDYALIKNLISSNLDCLISGQGVFKITSNKVDINNKILSVKVNLEKGNIRVPYVYNIIKDLRCNIIFDFNDYTLTIRNLDIALYQGRLKCLKSVLFLDDKYYLKYLDIPLILNNCLISYQRKFLGLVDGNLTLNYNASNNSSVASSGFIYGDLSLGKSQFNVSSSNNDKNITSLSKLVAIGNYNIGVDINLISKIPLAIKLGSLEANSEIKLNIGGSLWDPEWIGDVVILDGVVKFPYKSLYINYGKLILNSKNISKSNIDLIAKNNIKNYNIALFVKGKTNEPSLRLTSNPYLEQEQIIALLFGGTHQGELYTAMPQMLMKTFKDLMLGDNNTLKSIFKPFKNIRFIPVNIDQSNGKDISGAIELDINDNLRAMVQSSLNFKDNSRIEVDYALSDDISLKGIKDQKGDLEAELELRWKF